jgi:hypothetical protein
MLTGARDAVEPLAGAPCETDKAGAKGRPGSPAWA